MAKGFSLAIQPIDIENDPLPNGRLPQAQHDENRKKIATYARLAFSEPWKGRGASSQWAVMVAIYELADKCGRTVISFSVRQIAERARVGKQTAYNALCALGSTRSLISRIEQGGANFNRPFDKPYATLWRLNRPPFVVCKDEDNRNTLDHQIVSPCLHTPSDTDVWRNRSGLGKSAHRVYVYLSVVRSTKEIVAYSGLCRRTVVNTTNSLSKHGLISRTKLGWIRTDKSVFDVAKTLKSYGSIDRQRELHARQREQFADLLVRVGTKMAVYRRQKELRAGNPVGPFSSASIDTDPFISSLRNQTNRAKLKLVDAPLVSGGSR